jgi:hypothetical protein
MTSTIKVNTVTTESGSTLTLGESGKTIALASGASQTGFGRTGTVDWDTTPKTATFTAVSGDGFFANTTAGAFTCNLPAGAAGAIVSLADYAGTWDSNALTVSPNGSDKIGGTNADVTLNTEGQSVTFVFVDSTQGWVNVQDSTSNERANAFVAATGGTITTSGNFKIHTFTGPGTFTVTNAGAPSGSNTVDYLVIAGGGSGGTGNPTYNLCGEGGGGGAGGYRESSGAASGCYTRSPLGACVSALPVSVQAYPITVGGGAPAQTGGSETTGNQGSNSIFSTITSTGGGAGNGRNNPGAPTSPIPAAPACGQKTSGGSGGGAGQADSCASSQHFGSGNHPPVSPSQGNPGGRSAWPAPSSGPGYSSGGGGGGGATTVGGNAPGYDVGGVGGSGATSCITASPVTRAGGGGGAQFGPSGSGSGGGPGGGGNGSSGSSGGAAGTINTGSGGGGGGGTAASGAGGSGLVVIRYKFQ